MTDEIKQQYTLDASQVLRTMAQLDKYSRQYTDSVKAQTRALQELNRAGRAGPRTMKSLESSTAKASQAVHRLTVDWQTCARIVSTQAIVRALSTMRNAFKASIADAEEFSRRVHEIGTISDESIRQIQRSTLGMSNQFAIGLDTLAESKYQTISNSFADASDQMDVLTASFKFSKVAVAEADDSVNLITGTLNAFEKDASEASDVAAKFFKTIKLGRTRGSELAASMGTAATSAAELGVQLEELQAGFTSITVGGVKTAIASTQLRALFTALIKPSDKLKEVLKKLGYESGQQAISALGLQGALQAVRKEVGGNLDAMGRLFPNVRSLGAALRITGSGAAKFASDLHELESTSRKVLDKEYKIILETNAESVKKELNQLKNWFTTDFGTAVLKGTNDMFKFAGGAQTVIRGLESFSGPAVIATGALGAVGAALLTANLRAKLLAANVGVLGSAMTGLGLGLAAIGTGKYIGASIADMYMQEDQATKEAMKKLLDYRAEKVSAEKSIEEKKFLDLIRLQRQELAEKRKVYFSEIEAAKGRSESLLSDTRYYLDKIIGVHRQKLSELERVQSTANANILKSEENIAGARASAEDRLFDLKISNLKSEYKFRELIQRAGTLASKAAGDLAKGDEGARAEFQRANAFAEQALSLAKQSENRAEQNQAADILTKILNQQVSAEKQYQGVQAASIKQAEAKAKLESDRLRQLVTLQKQILSGFESGKVQEATKSLSEFLSGEHGMAVTKLRLMPQAFQDVQAQMEQAGEKRVLPFKAKLKGIVDFEITSENIDQALTIAVEKHGELLTQQQKVQKAQDQIAAASVRASKAIDKIDVSNRFYIGDTKKNLDQLRANFAALIDKPINEKIVNELKAQVDAMRGSLSNRELLHYSTALEAMGQKAQAFKTISENTYPPETRSRLQDLINGLIQANVPATQLRDTTAQTLRNLQQASQITINPQTVSKMLGGVVYRAGGGTARGTDRIPAMLSEGEFVVNARSARQFYSQLTAINAGVQPVYRDNGGSVYNTNVGDIIVNESKTPEMTAKQIVDKIKRAQRRGAVTIRN